MHNAMLHDYRARHLFPQRYDCLRHAQQIMRYQTVHTSETTALSISWKQKPIGIRVSVSKVYVNFFLWCCSQTEGYSDCLLRFLDHTHTHTHTHVYTLTAGLLKMSDQLVAQAANNTQQTTKKEKERIFHLHIWIQTGNPTKESDAELHIKPVS